MDCTGGGGWTAPPPVGGPVCYNTNPETGSKMAQPERELPRFNRLVYASGALAGNAISRSRDLWLIFFFAPPADEPDLPTLIPRLTLVALILAVRIIDALDDPLIGWWSDRTRSRWGRRIPFVVVATPFWVVFFVLLFTPPEGQSTLFYALYVFLILEFFNLFSTLSGGPFESLLPEIAGSSRDRVSIVTWQVAFGSLGAFIGLVLSGLIIDVFSIKVMAGAMAAVALVSRYAALAGAWRHVKLDVEPARIGPLQAIRATFRNDQFLFFLPTFILFSMSISLMTAVLPFFAESVLLADGPVTVSLFGFSAGLEKGALTGLFAAAAIVVVLASLPLAYRLAVRRGKAWVYSAAMLVGSLYLPLLFFMGFLPGVDKLMQGIIFVGLIGVPTAAVFTFPNAIQADIIDYDALRTGMRREAVYYATQAMLEKMAFSLFPLILALVLLLGETADNPLGIRLMGPVAGLLSLMGWTTFRGYRLPDEVTEESVREAGLQVKEPGPSAG